MTSRSSLSRCIALSATEAEFLALCDVVCDMIYLAGQLVSEMGYHQKPIVTDEDNTGVLSYVRDHHKYAHRRHIDIKYKFVQQHWEQLFTLVNDVRGKDNPADIFTKATLTSEQFQKYLDYILPGKDDSEFVTELDMVQS